jgi:hypothetical protein
MANAKTTTLTLRIDPAVTEALRSAAQKEYRSIANMVEVLVRDYWQRQGVHIPEQKTLLTRSYSSRGPSVICAQRWHVELAQAACQRVCAAVGSLIIQTVSVLLRHLGLVDYYVLVLQSLTTSSLVTCASTKTIVPDQQYPARRPRTPENENLQNELLEAKRNAQGGPRPSKGN